MCFTVQLSRFLSFFLSATAFILYQSCFCLSRTFLTFFKVFCYFRTFYLFIAFVLATHLYYHLFSYLSTTFLFTDNIVKVLYFLCHLSATTLILYHSCTPSVNIFFIFFTQKETLKNGNAFLRVSSIIIVY